ncbi:MAG: NAD(P)H-binding protein [Polyangiales bacterium]
MKVILFGATGMVGQGVLRECLEDATVEELLVVGRSACSVDHPKVRQIVREDLFDYADIEDELSGYDACFFCLGVSAAGMDEAQYSRITYDLTLAAARTLARVSPKTTFVYVSGHGTDSSEQGRAMWARVKGKTENELLKLPFESAYMFRPAFIQPKHGITSRTRLYRVLYSVFGPLFPILDALFPKYITTTEQVGRAMLAVAKEGHSTPIVDNEAIRAFG